MIIRNIIGEIVIIIFEEKQLNVAENLDWKMLDSYGVLGEFAEAIYAEDKGNGRS